MNLEWSFYLMTQKAEREYSSIPSNFSRTSVLVDHLSRMVSVNVRDSDKIPESADGQIGCEFF
jgi:hypothetical protein